MPCFGIYFLTYEYTQHLLGVDKSKHDEVMNLDRIWSGNRETWNYIGKKCIAGATAGEVGWLVNYPLDTIKTHIQVNYLIKHSIVSAAREIYSQHGIIHFFNGIGPCMIRAAPVNAICFVSFEIVSLELQDKFNL